MPRLAGGFCGRSYKMYGKEPANYRDDPNYLQTAGRTLEILQLFWMGKAYP